MKNNLTYLEELKNDSNKEIKERNPLSEIVLYCRYKLINESLYNEESRLTFTKVKYKGKLMDILKLEGKALLYNGEEYNLFEVDSRDNMYISEKKGVLVTQDSLSIPISDIKTVGIKGFDDKLIPTLFGSNIQIITDFLFKPILIEGGVVYSIEGEIEFRGEKYYKCDYLSEDLKKKFSNYRSSDLDVLKIEGFDGLVINLEKVQMKGIGIIYVLEFENGDFCITYEDGELIKLLGYIVEGFSFVDLKLDNKYIYLLSLNGGKRFYVDENMTILRKSNIFNILTGEEKGYKCFEAKYSQENVSFTKYFSDETMDDYDGPDDYILEIEYSIFGSDVLISFGDGVFTSFGKKVCNDKDEIITTINVLGENLLTIDLEEDQRIILNNEYKTLLYKGFPVNHIYHKTNLEVAGLIEVDSKKTLINKKGYINISYGGGIDENTVALQDLYFKQLKN